MTDIRTRLADALQEAINNVPVGVPDATDWPSHIADVLLSLPGIAILELPEVDLERGFITEPGMWSINLTERKTSMAVGRDRQWSPTDLREFAAALLATANAAEAKGER